mmetsp:Transcript_6631/g.13454  ORF Transcript_6631/g.13454 Transcript_6631/m.13454 type:complete len:281 (-) Transcript_6631:1090-1932(-)
MKLRLSREGDKSSWTSDESRSRISGWVNVAVADEGHAGPIPTWRSFEFLFGAEQVNPTLERGVAAVLEKVSQDSGVEAVPASAVWCIVDDTTQAPLWRVKVLGYRKDEVFGDDGLPIPSWEVAEALRQEGNQLARAQKWREAETAYRKALDWVRSPSGGEGSNDPRWSDLRGSLHLNLSLVLLKQHEFVRCVSHCDLAVNYGQRCGKAFYRRAQAMDCLGLLEIAETDLVRAEQLTPTDPAISKALSDVRKRIIEKRNLTRKEFARTYGLELQGRLYRNA